jgi:hypothetical protein
MEDPFVCCLFDRMNQERIFTRTHSDLYRSKCYQSTFSIYSKVSNSKALEGHISGKKYSAGRRRLREKWLCGPHLLSKTIKPLFLVEILSTFWVLKLMRATETLLAGLMQPAGRVFETHDIQKNLSPLLKLSQN